MKWLVRGLVAVMLVLVVAALGVLTTTHGQSSFLGGIVTYDPANQWVMFTDPTGTWHAPLAITNSAAPKNSAVEFTVNTDDQFVIQTYGAGNPESFLDIDTDGSASLFGSGQGVGGGGVGVEAVTGDTCIPSTRPAPCSPTSLRVGSNGIVDGYLGQATSGNGISTLLYSVDATLTGTFGPYTIYTTKASGYGSGGMYRLTGYMTVTSAAPGTSMQFVVDYADESGFQAENSGLPVPFQGVRDKLPFSIVFYCRPGQPIDISTVATGGSPNYTLHLRLEEL
jgi:hypothetical protein